MTTASSVPSCITAIERPFALVGEVVHGVEEVDLE